MKYKKHRYGNSFDNERSDHMGSDKNKDEEKERMKYEIAEELGLLDKVKEGGWKSLTSKETGRIGGLMTKRKREQKLEK